MKKKTPHRKRVLLLLGWYSPLTEEGIVRYAREAGWSLDLQTIRSGAFPEHEGIDGILSILGGWGTRHEFTDFVRNTSGIPVVDMHADLAKTIPAGRVLADNVAIGRLAAEHFLERGFKHFLFVCKSLADGTTAEREKGFRARLRESGFSPTPLACYSEQEGAQFFSPRHCVELLTRTLADAPQPLAVFAENDDFALLVFDACSRLKLKVPEDVAVLGCNNDPLVVDFAPVPLSSVDPDLLTRSFMAAQLLDRMMAGAPRPRKPLLIKPTGVVLRRSTDILAVEDPRLAEALSFIRLHFSDASLYPQAVADACHANLSTLNRSILRHLKRSLSEDIRLVRLHHARQLLLEGDRTVSEIATLCGFTNLLHFRRTFQRDCGTSPRHWRKKHTLPQTP